MYLQQIALVAAFIQADPSLGSVDQLVLRVLQLQHIHIPGFGDGAGEEQKLVVLDGFRGKYAYLNDPAQGEVMVTEEEFDQAFTGIAIIPTPSDTFEPGGKQRSTVDFARKRLIGAGAAVSFVMITTAISYLFGIINSVSSRIFMDRLLTGINRDWLGPFLHLLILLAVIQLAVAWAQAVFSLRVNGKMSVIGRTSYMWKVYACPWNSTPSAWQVISSPALF